MRHLLIVCVAVSCGDPNEPALLDQRIAFQSDRTGDFDIFAMEPDGSNLVNLTLAPGAQFHPAWTRDHSRLAFTSDVEPAGLRIMNRDGTGLTELLSAPGDDAYPAWSPDGRQIAFRSARSGFYAIWIVNADGTGLRQVTNLHDGESFPTWAADGQRLAFDRLAGAIYDVNIQGTDLRQLTFPPDVSYDAAPAWSPDGSLLAFQRFTSTPDGANAPQRIFVVERDGSGLRQLSQFAAGQDWTPAWSRDGSRIAFAHEIGGEFDIYVVNVDGTEQRRLTLNGGIQFRPAW